MKCLYIFVIQACFRVVRPRVRSRWALCLLLCWGSGVSADTVVRFDTVLGSFEVQLYDRAGPERSTPLTAANFLNYVHSGAYEDTFFHRSAEGFVLQGGGFTLPENTILSVPTEPPVPNEPGNSNVRGTIAMAKIDGDPDSATNQWFFNLADNSENLDAQNGGFTVFGHVVGDGMEVVDALAAITAYDASSHLGPTFSALPLLEPVLAKENILFIHDIQVVPFEVKAPVFDEGTVTLRWSGAGDTPVKVLRSTNLISTEWEEVATDFVGGEYVDSDPPSSGTVFYRVIKH